MGKVIIIPATTAQPRAAVMCRCGDHMPPALSFHFKAFMQEPVPHLRLRTISQYMTLPTAAGRLLSPILDHVASTCPLFHRAVVDKTSGRAAQYPSYRIAIPFAGSPPASSRIVEYNS